MIPTIHNVSIIAKTIDRMERIRHIGRMTTCEAHKTGRIGEQTAVAYLRRHGYKIIGRNLKSKVGELDIVAAIADILVFVEVKTRTSTWAGEAYEAVNVAKQKKLAALVAGYLAYGGVRNLSERFVEVRIDVIGVLMTKNGEIVRVDHIKDAFTP